jgi:hypothetical protein
MVWIYESGIGRFRRTSHIVLTRAEIMLRAGLNEDAARAAYPTRAFKPNSSV